MKMEAIILCCSLVASCATALLSPPACASGDYFYSSGVRHEIKRLPDSWAVHVPRATTRGGGRHARVGWERHGIDIVRAGSAAEARRKRQSLVERSRFVNPVFDYGAGAPLVVTDEFIVRFPRGLGMAAIEEINRRQGAAIVREIAGLPNCFVLRPERSGELAALHCANSYVESGDALSAQPNFVAAKKKRSAPNDPYLPRQWYLSSYGQSAALPGQDVDAPAAWDVTRGDPSVIIAVIDDGVDFSHEDLQGGVLLPGYDFFDGDGDPSASADNEDFHGTAVVGVIAANGDNGIGVTGIAPSCSIMPIRLVAGPTSDEQDAGAIRWAAENGAWIISNSWGPPDGAWFIQGDEVVYPLPDIVRDAIDWAADNGRSGKGCVVVWAAGNGNEPVGYDGYASYDKVLAVGACTDQGQRSYYSDYGSELDLCAPSDGGRTSGIWTTDLSGTAGYNAGSASFGDAAGNYYSAFGGTSSAAPLVAGAAALLLSREPELTREEVMQRITGTADRVDIAHAGYDLNGHSLWYGHGRVNTCSALTGRTRHPQLSISAVPGAVRSGDTPALSFQLLRGRDTRANGGAVYLVVVPPWGGMLFVRPDYGLTEDAFPFVRRVVAVDMSGSIGPGVPLAGAPPGLYTIYAGIVANGGDPYSPASWMHTPASALLSVTP